MLLLPTSPRATSGKRMNRIILFDCVDARRDTSFRAAIKNNAWTRREIIGSLGNIDSLKTKIKSGDWNTCRIVAKGNRLQHYINDILMSDVTDADMVNRKLSGLLGVQVHVGPPMTVEYRNIFLKQF